MSYSKDGRKPETHKLWESYASAEKQ